MAERLDGLIVIADASQEFHLTAEGLRDLVTRALLRAGFSEVNAGPIADTITASEVDGVASHGVLRLPGFVDAVRTRWADGQARPRLLPGARATIVADARNGFAQPALALAREAVTSAAREHGVATLLIRNTHHFAALSPDIESLAQEGFIVLSCVNSRARMSAWGGSKPVLGTNVTAFASPRQMHPPLIWDQSSSVMSQGDLILAARDGKAVPLGTGRDAGGHETTSAADILNGGTISPFGGNKGASIAAMVEILAGALTGSCFGFENPQSETAAAPSKGGQFMLVIDPAGAGASVAARVDLLAEAIMDGGANRLPGDRRYEARRRTREQGIWLGAQAHESLIELAGQD